MSAYRSGLRVNSSLGGKTELVIERGSGRSLNWYGCGPTVYDAPHMGHARTYVSFDILRRIMQNYFGYNIRMVVNVTDIDDKIIQRANEQGKDFADFARYWEQIFWEDMKALNVLDPDVVTRVSEHVEEIIKYIQKIIDNKFAYASCGSVYFDLQAFRKDEKHEYGMMEPGAVNEESRVLEGEGNLGGISNSDKKSPLDFVLWKKAKDNEPFWQSPWGPGRPGWHIECSAMACRYIEYPLDIHSGGVDLRFPHHANELAQSEAYYDKPSWVKYFLHTGHLNIQGAKMSKSLKNFVSIQDVLEKYTHKHVRILCLLNRWDSPMNYSSDGETMKQTVDLDRIFINFFKAMSNELREPPPPPSAEYKPSFVRTGIAAHKQKWNDSDYALDALLITTQEQIREYLCDNFNTKDALVKLQSLISAIYNYLKDKKKCEIKLILLRRAATYVFQILKIFGLTNGSEESLAYEEVEGNWSEMAHPVIDSYAEFRQEIRDICSNGAEVSLLRKACDKVRDERMPGLGIDLQDKSNGFAWSISTPEKILANKIASAEAERTQKEQNRRSAAAKEAKRLEEVQIPPKDYFRILKKDEFSEFGDNGLPTKNANGEPLSKSSRDKLTKLLAKHTTAHEQWLLKKEGE